jgi:hypothetical protein
MWVEEARVWADDKVVSEVCSIASELLWLLGFPPDPPTCTRK